MLITEWLYCPLRFLVPGTPPQTNARFFASDGDYFKSTLRCQDRSLGINGARNVDWVDYRRIPGGGRAFGPVMLAITNARSGYLVSYLRVVRSVIQRP